MRILIAHNFYRAAATSGEDAVYRSESALLESQADVIRYEKYNDEIDATTFRKRIGLALNSAWSRASYLEIERLIRQKKPDIVHFHNTFPLISPSGYAACKAHGIPVIQTLHNYRVSCANGLLLRDEKPCELCVGRFPWAALRYRCYRQSLLATSAQVWAICSNRMRNVHERLIDRYIALTKFAAGKFVESGIPEERIVIKPNALMEIPQVGEGRGGYAVFAGRLGPEKGLKVLLEALREVPPLRLKVFGDGPLRRELESFAHARHLAVEFMGLCSKANVMVALRDADFLVMPSLCYEGVPMVLLEALACGTPVVASRIGSLDELVREGVTGLKFEAGNASDLAGKLRHVLSAKDVIASMRRHARSEFLNHYTPHRNIERLKAIYRDVLEEKASRRR